MNASTTQKDQIETAVIQQISSKSAWHYKIIPRLESNGVLHLYTCDQNAVENLKNELEILLGKKLSFDVITQEKLHHLLNVYYRKSEKQAAQKKWIPRDEDFLSILVLEAKNLGSSDIHIEVFEKVARIRFRIDGKLIEKIVLEKEDYPSIINRIKIQSNLDIAEKRLPQDGRIHMQSKGQELDIRVSVLPTMHGEKVVLRILGGKEAKIKLSDLGFTDSDLENYMRAVQRPEGMVLISGPTGSGKTTTLYGTLQELNDKATNIITIEDPIEYTLEGINQVQLKERIGLNFPKALKSFLRQDPDVIMVGEIRDVETATMAVRASLTGHKVLSTIHTNSAWGIISRLIDMGLPPYLLADTLNVAVAQRLVRQLCPVCKQEKSEFSEDLGRELLEKLGSCSQYFAPKGCTNCHFTGFSGRKAIYEVVPIDRELAHEIRSKNLDIQEIMERKGISSLADNAINMLYRGETALSEVIPLLKG